MLDHLSSTVLLYSPLVVHTLVAPATFVSILQESRTRHVNIRHMNEGATYAMTSQGLLGTTAVPVKMRLHVDDYYLTALQDWLYETKLI